MVHMCAEGVFFSKASRIKFITENKQIKLERKRKNTEYNRVILWSLCLQDPQSQHSIASNHYNKHVFTTANFRSLTPSNRAAAGQKNKHDVKHTFLIKEQSKTKFSQTLKGFCKSWV
jgi:hypothetical protein